jgi:alpha-mannosidase
MKMRYLFAAITVVFLFLLTMSAAAQTQKAQQPDLSKEPTLYVVGYAHLDTEWRWEYPQVIDEYLRRTMEDNFKLFDKYPHYVFNFSGANRYRFMKEYFPEDFARLKQYVDQGRWYPAGSSMEEGDVNAPSAEAIIRQILYGNNWFRKEFGKSSAEYMLPDCFGFPASLPTILAHSGVKAFSTQKLVWGSSADGGGVESLERTPEGTPFNVGVWVGPDGESVLAGLNPGSYSGGIESDLSKPLPPEPANPAIAELRKKLDALQQKGMQLRQSGKPIDAKDIQEYMNLRGELIALSRETKDNALDRYQDDWAARVLANGKVSGVFTDYHYYGTGDIGGAPSEDSVKRLEAIVTRGTASLPPQLDVYDDDQPHPAWPSVQVGDGPVHVISATADQMFLDITPTEAEGLPRYTGEMELTNHSAGSLTSEAYQKRWIRKEELLADAAEKSSLAAEWLGARSYPLARLNDAWTLAMGEHFHDLAAGTATPKAYEFAWNDDVIALNQFAGVLNNAAEAVAAGMNTETKGVPVVVFNPLNIAREDLVEASINFPSGLPASVHVTGPGGNEVPSQISAGKVIFVASVPSVGYAVYDVQPGVGQANSQSTLKVTQRELENQYYRVKLNDDGDIAQIFDKLTGRELLSAPARLAISYDNPAHWPAWNMDWEQEQAVPKAYVSGPAKIRILEDGPARIALEVARETSGSRFVQTVSLSAGDAGRRVEFGNVVDWNTRESNLKAVFPLTASNQMATYNWDIGTIERPTAEPKKFEVPSHQWVDLTDMSGQFGATILTDCKNGSDKPNDNTLRLTLIRTPGTAGGYADQGTQDIGHHEFVFGITGHAGDWRTSQSDWQAQRLNAPLIAFATAKHAGALGSSFSFLNVSNARIRVLALKKAELSDEIIVRLVELDGKPQSNVHISFAAPVMSAREVNGQEQPVGDATVSDGELVTSFSAYEPRTFALHLAQPVTQAASKISAVNSQPVALKYDLSAASNHGDKSSPGFDGKGNALPAEILPAQIDFNNVRFELAAAKTGTPNALVAKGQTIQLPAGEYNRVYLIAASSDGDQRAEFKEGNQTTELNVQDWGGFIGQWDDRQWSSKDTSHDNYGEMIGLKPGFIKRASLAWYANHYHNPAGQNVAYAYAYLFAYALDLQHGARTLVLPKNDKIRILAISVAEENPETTPVQPLYDELPAPHAAPDDFTLTAPSAEISISQGRSATASILVLPRGSFKGEARLSASSVPSGLSVSFDPPSTSGLSTMRLTSSNSMTPGTVRFNVDAVAGSVTHSASVTATITPILSGTVPVDLSSVFNVTGIYKDGATFTAAQSLDRGGYALSEQELGSEQVGSGVIFKFGTAGVPDAIFGQTVALPAGKYSSVRVLATAVDGNQEMQNFTVNYTDGTSSSFTQSISDWAVRGHSAGESTAVKMKYRLMSDGSKDGNTFYLNAYTFTVDGKKTLQSISLPTNRDVLVFAMTLVP